MRVSGNVDQVDRNYEAFLARLPDLLREYEGRFALLHDAKVVAFYSSSLEATLEGLKQYKPGDYSVQEVTSVPDHLGFYSYVGGTGAY